MKTLKDLIHFLAILPLFNSIKNTIKCYPCPHQVCRGLTRFFGCDNLQDSLKPIIWRKELGELVF